MAANFSELAAQVERIKQVRPSIEAIIDGIADRIQAAVEADNAGDNSMLATLADDVRNEADGLVAAAMRGTPGEPAPEPTPEPTPEEGGGTAARNR